MTARPTDAGSFGEAVYEQLEPIAEPYDADNGWALLILSGALGQLFQQFDDIVRGDDVDPTPWSKLLDINRIPDEGVPWLGQFFGVQVDTSLTPDQQRQQVRSLEQWARGRPDYMKDVIRRSGGLIGNQSIILRERDSSAWHFTVITYPNETLGPLCDTYDDVYAEYVSYADLLHRLPRYTHLYYGLGGGMVYDAILESKPAADMFTYSIVVPQDYWGIWTDFADYTAVYNIAGLTYQNVYDYASVAGVGSPGLPIDSIYADPISVQYDSLWNTYQTYEDIYRTFNHY